MYSKIIALSATLLLTVSCVTAPKGSHEEISRMEKSITEFSSISVSASTSLDEAADATSQLEQSVASELKKSFPSIKVTKGTKGAAKIKLKITDYNKVSKVGRFVAGTMAGSDKIVVDVEVYEGTQLIGSFRANGEMQSAQFWSDGTKSAISEVAKEVSKYLRARN